MRTLRELGKGEQLAIEMERNGLVVLGVTKTHLLGSADIGREQRIHHAVLWESGWLHVRRSGPCYSP